MNIATGLVAVGAVVALVALSIGIARSHEPHSSDALDRKTLKRIVERHEKDRVGEE